MICIESIVSGNNNLVLTTEAQFYQILKSSWIWLNLKNQQLINKIPTDLRRYIFWWLYPYRRVPFPRRQDCHLIKEFIDTSNYIISIFSFIGNIMENLQAETYVYMHYISVVQCICNTLWTTAITFYIC